MPPKKTAKPKVKAKAKALERAPTIEKLVDKAGEEKLQTVLDELVKCYDEDEDGLIERVEFLDGEEKKVGKLEFNVKMRRAAFAWFKEAGAEGTTTDGMFLAPDKFKAALAKRASEQSEIPAAEPAKLAEWMLEDAKGLIAACYKGPPAAASSAGAAEPAAAAVEEPPQYPLTCPLRDFQSRVEEARRHGRYCLVLSNGLTEVETFLSYKQNVLVDCKQYLGELFVKKSKTKADVQEELRGKFETAMNTHGHTQPLHVRMGNSAFDLKGLCCEQVPEDIFSCTLWTIENALKRGFFEDGHKIALEVEKEKKWNDYYVLITSTFDLEKANEYLFDKIPHYDELAIISIDPKSVA